jgi:N-acetylmuramoyl-L-alanine amidase
MRKITHIVIHCTGTQPEARVEAIQKYWREVMKWRSPGYHYLIEANGDINFLQENNRPTNGVSGHNAGAIHVCYIGGIDRQGKPSDTRTAAQNRSLEAVVRSLRSEYPQAQILGHRDFPGVKKACPSFEVSAWLRQIKLV